MPTAWSRTASWPLCRPPWRPTSGSAPSRRGWRCVYEPRAVTRHVRTYSPSTPRDRLAAGHRRMQFRNRLLMAYKNETPLGLLVHLPWIVGYEIAALGFALLRERELLGAYS